MHRREMLKSSLLSGGAVLLSAKSSVTAVELPTGGIFDTPSPASTAFMDELPLMPTKASLPGGVKDLLLPVNGAVAPNGTVYPQVTGNDALTTYPHSLERIVASHQRNSGNNIQFPPQRLYVLDVRQNKKHVFHRGGKYQAGSVIWGYDGMYPGPTFISRYGVPILVRIINSLYDDKDANGLTKPIPGGFGDPRISTHLHNGHTGSESDGNPVDIYPPVDRSLSPVRPYPASIQAIRFRDHHYPMFRAGLDPTRPTKMPPPNVNDGASVESVSTLWYHDHSMDFTSENVYKGLVGFHLVFDEIDSSNENDTDTRALCLPSGKYDIPLLFQDKYFDAAGQLFFDQNGSHRGRLGDKFVVNGKIQPTLTVQRRKYRFRLLNAGPSRFYQFFLTKTDEHAKKEVDLEFTYIGNDESLLEHPLRGEKSVLLSVAERGEIVIDFSKYKKNEKLYLENRLVMQSNGQGPRSIQDKKTGESTFVILGVGEGDKILEFVVGDDAPDPSKVPDVLRLNPDLPPEIQKAFDNEDQQQLRAISKDRTFRFGIQTKPPWLVNDQIFDDTLRQVLPKQGPPGGAVGVPDGEVWTIINTDVTWSHPIHIHLEEFRILLRNGKKPPVHERSKKDVLVLRPGEEVQLFLRFRDFLGKYPIHCHNVIHEDHSMMMRFDVIG